MQDEVEAVRTGLDAGPVGGDSLALLDRVVRREDRPDLIDRQLEVA